MPRYLYKARDNEGRLSTGTLTASDADHAGAMIRAQGRFVVSLDRTRDRADAVEVESAPSSGKVKRSEVITFAHQLAVMIDTGVPISEALECIMEQTANPAFRAVLTDITRQVQAGGELSTGLAAHQRVFPRIMISLVKASEASGTMGTMLDRISSYLAKEQQTLRTVRGALTYPAVMMSMVLLVTVFLLAFVMPRFAGVYQQRGAALPAPTQLLMTLSQCLVQYWWAWLIGLVALVATVIIGLKTEAGRDLIDLLKIRAPVFGSIFNKLYVTRSCRALGTMLAAGVPILDAVAIVREVTANARFEALWAEVDRRLQQGAQLSDPLFDSTLFPRSVSQMIFAGEKSGRLCDTLDKIAKFTEDEFDAAVKQSTQYLEPLLVVTMGSIIGFVAIALLLPIFSVSTVVSGG